MTALIAGSYDPHDLAEEVRDVAIHAYKTKLGPVSDLETTRALTQRIQKLQAQLGKSPAQDLSLWLENLRREVERNTAVPSHSARRKLAPCSAAPC